MVHSQNTTIFTYNTFTINKVQLHVSAINGGHLQVVHEALNDKLYLPREWVCSLWDGVGARARFLLVKGCGSGLLKYCSSLLITISTSRLHFDVCCLILKKLYKHGLCLKYYGLVFTVSCIFCTKNLYHVHWELCTLILQSFFWSWSLDQPIPQCYWKGGWPLISVVGGNKSRDHSWILSLWERRLAEGRSRPVNCYRAMCKATLFFM
jgi:hypothetical protein